MNRTLGVKLTHDAGVCLMEGDRIVFSTELEKVDNGARYGVMPSEEKVLELLAREGYALGDVGVISIDGWRGGRVKGFPGLELSGYNELAPPPGTAGEGVEGLRHTRFLRRECLSFNHSYNHITSSVCTSPFGEGAVVVWDGGQLPTLYRFDERGVRGRGRVVGAAVYGLMYSVMGFYFGPYSRPTEWREGEKNYPPYDWAGKLMSYMSSGEESGKIKAEIGRIYRAVIKEEGATAFSAERWGMGAKIEHTICARIKEKFPRAPHADLLLNTHCFLIDELLSDLTKLLHPETPLVFTGGSALNIKWNSRLRSTFPNFYVPPFPNDSGSAIGAAISARAAEAHGGRFFKAEWSVYCGPRVEIGSAWKEGWERGPGDAKTVARLLADRPTEIVAALIDRAEVGPRALGHRSLLCAATEPTNKARLNHLKRREHFRPVAPICLEGTQDSLFSPGGRDPFMLYDHQLLPKARRMFPAISHTDNSARLQTLGPEDCAIVYEMLREYERATGCGVLCNTSANFNGSGFFSDFASAARLECLNWIWDGVYLYRRKEQ